MKKGKLVYEGKAKKVFEVENHPQLYWLEFKDSLTAFNALKKGSFENKGALNHKITSIIFKYLNSMGINSHWVRNISLTEMIVQKLEMIPLEVVVRNVLAGSTAKKFQIEEGQPLETPLVELYYKEDKLGDPFLNDEQALMMKAAHNQNELDQLKETALKINQHLIHFFDEMGIQLIDFKIEFGRLNNQIILADEITPDSCRLWDKKTNEKLDKDRFRRDLGNVKESYEKVGQLMVEKWGGKL